MSNVKAVLACPSCSETTFGDTPAASAIVAAEWRKSYSLIRLETSQLKYHFEMLGEIIGMDWVSRRRFEDQVTALWTQTVGARFRLQITKKRNNPALQFDRPTAPRTFRIAEAPSPI